MKIYDTSEGTVIDTSQTGVVVYLSEQEREHIKNMPDSANGFYASFPSGTDKELMEKFLDRFKIFLEHEL